jgi:hypothetical protein
MHACFVKPPPSISFLLDEVWQIIMTKHNHEVAPLVFTAGETAALLKASPKTVCRLVTRGFFKFNKSPRTLAHFTRELGKIHGEQLCCKRRLKSAAEIARLFKRPDETINPELLANINRRQRENSDCR